MMRKTAIRPIFPGMTPSETSSSYSLNPSLHYYSQGAPSAPGLHHPYSYYGYLPPQTSPWGYVSGPNPVDPTQETDANRRSGLGYELMEVLQMSKYLHRSERLNFSHLDYLPLRRSARP